MTRVAIPVFNQRVAPVFDWAGILAIVEISSSAPNLPVEQDVTGLLAFQRSELLLSENIEVLICGGISCQLAAEISDKGIKVIAGIAGDTNQVIDAFTNGQLDSARWALPGWCGGFGRGRGRGRRFRSGQNDLPPDSSIINRGRGRGPGRR
jgi:predicted Fe-Mo cluster-binding NifX family protein